MSSCECGKPILARFMCASCYNRWYRTVGGRHKCKENRCNRPRVARGMCLMHYKRWRRRLTVEELRVLRNDKGFSYQRDPLVYTEPLINIIKAEGWSMRDLARRLDMDPANLRRFLNRPLVSAYLADTIISGVLHLPTFYVYGDEWLMPEDRMEKVS